MSHANNSELRELRAKYNLTTAEIAKAARTSTSLVESWLAPPDRSYARTLRDNSMRLIKLELGLAKPAFRHLRQRADKLRAEIRGQ